MVEYNYGWERFLAFAVEGGAVTAKERDRWEERAIAALRGLVAMQPGGDSGEEPVCGV